MNKKFTNMRKVAKMQVGAINNQAFCGKTKTTKNGNEYKEARLGKTIGTTVGLGFATYDLYKIFKKDFFKEFSQKLIDENGHIFSKKSISAFLVVGVALAVAIEVGVGRLLGAIPDAIANHSRAKKADNEAKLEERLEAKIEEKVDEALSQIV